ncbi:transglycosylase SLT domain-containing protein [Nocardia sp. IFM 10818]
MSANASPIPNHRALTILARTAAAAAILAFTAGSATTWTASAQPPDLPEIVDSLQLPRLPELPVPAQPPAPEPAPSDEQLRLAQQHYSDDLHGWISEALDVMALNGIPGSYDGIHRNIMRESSGNPHAINLYDSNAAAGIPSKGLLQVIDPTFEAYHVEGTPFDIWDPVANITAACNYAAHRYGSIDNVFGAY